MNNNRKTKTCFKMRFVSLITSFALLSGVFVTGALPALAIDVGIVATLTNTSNTAVTYDLNSVTPEIASVNASPNTGSTNFAQTTYNFNITATFPYGATDKKVELSIAPGMNIASKVDAGGNDSALNEYLEALDWTEQTRLWSDVNTYLKDGKFTYSLENGTETVSIPVKLSVNPTVFAEIVGNAADPAIKAEMSYSTSSGTVSNSVQVTSFNCVLIHPNFEPDNNYEKLVATDTNEYMEIFNRKTNFKMNHTANTLGRYYDYVEWYLSVDKRVEYKGFQVNSFGVDAPTVVQDPNNTDNNLYCFRAEKVFVANNIFNPIWTFPSADFNNGDQIKVSTVKVVAKPWGNTERTYTYQTGNTTNGAEISSGVFNITRLQYEHTFTINNEALVWVNNANTHTLPDTDRNGTKDRFVYWRNEGLEDAIGILGGYTLGNRKASDSGPQEIKLHFDSTDIGVTAVDVPLNGGATLNEVWYKSVGNQTWTKVDNLNLPAQTASGGFQLLTDPDLLGSVLITNDGTLGLELGDYITDIKYIIPCVPATTELTMTASANNQGTYVYGRALTNENKTVVSTVEACDEGYDPNDSTTGSTTGIGIINTVLSDTQLSYSLTNAGAQTKSPGGILSFGNNTCYANVEAPTPYPVFYIREELGVGISDFKLTNNNGVNLVQKYGIEPEYLRTESDGTIVYKVDTSVIKNAAGVDKYDALIGPLKYSANPSRTGTSNRLLSISYKVVVPSDYRDGGMQHLHEDRIYITSSTPAYKTTYYAGTQPRDTHDVDGNGITDAGGKYFADTGDASGSGAYFEVASNNAHYYKIEPVPDVNVITQAKHGNAPEASYSSWETGEDYLQINAGENLFQVRITISNDSGVDIPNAVVYQPLPKLGQFWDDLSIAYDKDGAALTEYPWSAFLVNGIQNPASDLFDILYGTVPESDITDEGPVLESMGAAFVPIDQVADLEKVNCVKIVLKNGMVISDRASYPFVMNLNVLEPINEDNEFSVDIARSLYYRSYVKDSLPYAGWKNGSYAAVQLSNGRISGTVYLDTNQNSRVDGVDTVFDDMAGAVLKLYKKAQPNVVVQQIVVAADGTYSFSDLLRKKGEYILTVERPSGLPTQYIFSVADNTTEADGTIHNAFAPASGNGSATASDLYATITPGQRDDGITFGGNGKYDILIFDNTKLMLTIGETVEGNAGEPDREFQFRLTLKDSSGAPLSGSFDYIGASVSGVDAKANGSLSVNTSGVATFTLKHGQSIMITGLPKNCQYEIIQTEELYEQGYDTVTDNASSANLAESGVASFVNTRNVVNVPMLGSKTLTGGGKNTSDITAGLFTFGVTRTDAVDCIVAGLPAGATEVAADASIDFGTWGFYREGTYVFTVAENTPPEGYTISGGPVTVTVEVVKNATTGALEARAAYSSGLELSFENVYTPPTPPTPPTSSTPTSSTVTVPRTDDTGRIGTYLTLMTVAVCGMAVTLIQIERRRRQSSFQERADSSR